MTDSSSRGFLQAIALHAVAAGLALTLGMVAASREPDAPRIIELVAGEGDNYAATEAPARPRRRRAAARAARSPASAGTGT